MADNGLARPHDRCVTEPAKNCDHCALTKQRIATDRESNTMHYVLLPSQWSVFLSCLGGCHCSRKKVSDRGTVQPLPVSAPSNTLTNSLPHCPPSPTYVFQVELRSCLIRDLQHRPDNMSTTGPTQQYRWTFQQQDGHRPAFRHQVPRI